MELTQAHLEAVDRRRRIALNFDVSFAVRVRLRERPDEPVEELVEHLFGFTDSADVVTDSIWWNWSEGNQVPYASEFLPIFDDPTFKCWVDQGVDIVRLVLEATRRRGVESFYAHRMNGSDNDLGPFAELPMKVEHPDWMFRTPWCTHENNGKGDIRFTPPDTTCSGVIPSAGSSPGGQEERVGWRVLRLSGLLQQAVEQQPP